MMTARSEGSGGAGKLPSWISSLLDESIERYTLANGFTIILREDHSSRLASAQMWVKAGSVSEGELQGGGISHFLEHMIFKGTAKRSAVDITREVHAAGGYINAYTTFDRTVYYLDLPSEQLHGGLDILADITFCSTLPEKEVERERDVILREIDMGLDDPDRQLARAVFETAYRCHPYRFPVIGIREVFETLARDELAAYYAQRYVPNNAVLVVVGDFDLIGLKAEIERLFSPFPLQRLSSVVVPEEPMQLSRRDHRLFEEVNVCRGSVAFKIPGLADPRAPGIDLLSVILGGGNGSLLWRRLRDELKLVHDIDVSSWAPGDSGLLWISYLCDIEQSDAVVPALLETIEGIGRTGIDVRRVNRAVRQAQVSEINIRKTMGGQASRLGLAEVVVGDLGYVRRYFERLQEWSAKRLSELLERMTSPDQMISVRLEPQVAKQVTPRARNGSPPKAPSEDFSVSVLANGLRILTQSDGRLPKVHVSVAGLGGPLYETPDNCGITALMSTLLTKDTKDRSALEVAETIEDVGGSFFEFAGNNTFGLQVEVLPQDLDLALELLEQALLRPDFLPQTFALERDGQIAQIREDQDDIVEFGRRTLRREFFGDHPFANDSLGTEASLGALDIEDVKRQYARLVSSENLVVALSGAIEADVAREAVEARLSGLGTGLFEPASDRKHLQYRSGIHTVNMQREQAVVMVAYPDCGVADDQFYDGTCLEEFASEMSGRLFQKVRESLGLAYFIGANRIPGLKQGMFYFFAGTHPDHIEQVFCEVDEEVMRLCDGDITEGEVSRCCNRLKAQKRMSMQSMGSRAMAAALNSLYGLPINDWKYFDARIDRIGPDSLQRFARRYFCPSARVAVVVRP